MSDNGKIIVGVSTLPGEAALHGFSWTEESGMVELSVLPGATCPTKWCTYAYLVNDAGLIAGTTYGTDNQVHGVVWLPSGNVIDLGAVGNNYRPAALNASGRVVGSRPVAGVMRAFSWTLAGGMVDIAPPLAGSQSSAADINDNGQVVGAVNGHPFVWTHEGGLLEFGGLDGTPGFGSAGGVNASGQVVGTSRALDRRMHPFVWTQATGMIDLGMPANHDVRVRLISDSGWIAGTVTFPGSGSEPGRDHVFIWSVADYLPEPAAEPDPGPDPAVTPAGDPVGVAAAPGAAIPSTPVSAPADASLTPPARIAGFVKGNSHAAIKARTRAFAAAAGRIVRSLKACSTLTCRLRQVQALAAKQRSYAAWVRKDSARPGPCAVSARSLGTRLSASETARAALQRAIMRAQRGATQPLSALVRTTALKVAGAITSSRSYAATCG